MLNFFRNALKSWLVRFVLFGLLILSFGLWGVSDVFNFLNPTAGTLITVNGEEIDDRKFLSLYREQSNRLLQSGFPEELIAQSGIEQPIISRISLNNLLKHEMESLSLSISKNILRQSIEEAPGFQDHSGNFDYSVFENFLFSRGLNESLFLDELHDDLAASFIETVFLYSPKAFPKIGASFEEAWQKEQRDITYVSEPVRRNVKIKDPGDTILQQWMDDHAALFIRPEYRQIRFFHLDPKILEKEIVFSDTQLRAFYQERLSDYTNPEQRSYQQILFIDKENAEKIHLTLNNRSSLLTAGKNYNAFERSFTTKQDISDPAIAEQIFALAKNQISQVFKGRLGWYIVKVKNIKPEEKTSFQKLRKDIEQRAKRENILENLFQHIEKIEDSLILGADIANIASERNFQLITTPFIDRKGVTQKGTLFSSLPEDDIFLETAFNLDQNRASDPLESSEGAEKNGFYVFQIDSIEKQRPSTLKEIRSRIFLSWQENQHLQKARNILEKIGSEAKTGSTMKKAAQNQGRKANIKKNLTRKSAFLSPDIIRQVFETNKNDTAIIPDSQGNLMLIYIENTKITMPKKTTQENIDNLSQTTINALRGLYFNDLRQKYKVEINQNRLNLLIGGQP